MGGDHGPPVILSAAVKAIQLHPNVHFVLCGDENVIQSGIQSLTDNERSRVTISHCSQVVEMGEAPTSALRNKKDSSIAVLSSLLKVARLMRA